MGFVSTGPPIPYSGHKRRVYARSKPALRDISDGMYTIREEAFFSRWIPGQPRQATQAHTPNKIGPSTASEPQQQKHELSRLSPVGLLAREVLASVSVPSDVPASTNRALQTSLSEM